MFLYLLGLFSGVPVGYAFAMYTVNRRRKRLKAIMDDLDRGVPIPESRDLRAYHKYLQDHSNQIGS